MADHADSESEICRIITQSKKSYKLGIKRYITCLRMNITARKWKIDNLKIEIIDFVVDTNDKLSIMNSNE